MKTNTSLSELAKLFFTLGCTAFGGPAAHIALMRREVVWKRQWISEEGFLDLLGATNLIPGPNSTEMALHIGQERAGWRGLLVAGLCFIFPAVLMTGVLAWAYQRYGQIPQVQPFFAGMQPAILAIITNAMFPLARKACKTRELLAFGLTALLLSLAGCNEIFILFGAGFFALGLHVLRSRSARSRMHSVFPLPIFFIFLKIGALLYGSGYVLFAFLDAEFVAKGLLARNVLLDAISVGQFTPGPLFSSATFVGYQLAGVVGAVLATIGIFLPAFCYVGLLGRLIPKMRNSTNFAIFLDAVNVAAVAVVFAMCSALSKTVLSDWSGTLLFFVSFFVLYKFPKVNSALVLFGAALLGYFV